MDTFQIVVMIELGIIALERLMALFGYHGWRRP